MGHTRQPPATRNHGAATGIAARSPRSAATAARAAARDAKPDGRLRYRTSAKASGRSWRTFGSSQAASKRNLAPHPGGDSPRPRRPRWIPPVVAGGLASGSGKTELVAGSCPVRWLDTAGWRSAVASGGRQIGSPRCSSGPADDAAGSSAHSLSIDRCDGPDAEKRLARIAHRGNAEMGPRELLLPAGQVSLRSANFAARRFYSSPPFRWPTPSLQDSCRPTALPAISPSRTLPATPRKWPGHRPPPTATELMQCLNSNVTESGKRVASEQLFGEQLAVPHHVLPVR
jgi:hypothetical protein